MHSPLLFWMSVSWALMCGGERSSYIARRDKEFVGPDLRLALELRRRMASPAHRAAERSGPTVAPTPPAAERYAEPPTPPPASGRRQRQWHDPVEAGYKRIDDARARTYHNWWFTEYQAEFLKPKILNFQEYMIQLSKGYLEELEPLVKPYERDERVRMANIFSKLDRWVRRVRILLQDTLQARYRKEWHWWEYPVIRRVHRHYHYYMYILRSHIDITYTIEFLVHIHTEFMKKHYNKNTTKSSLGMPPGGGSGPGGGNYAGPDAPEDDVDQDEENVKQQKGLALYEEMKDKNLSEDQIRYMMDMIDAGLEPTRPP